MIRKLLRNQQVRNLIPRRVKVFYAEHRNWASPVRYRCGTENIFHCCVHKTGSQWIRRILFDPIIYAGCGLPIYAYQARMAQGERRPILERTFDRAFPPGRIISPLYISYQNFRAIPKPASYRAIFIGRDPRDLAVSWLFSTRNAHPGMKDNENRKRLRELDDRQGLHYAFQFLSESGEYEAMRSWFQGAPADPQCLVIRYEDLVGPDQLGTFSTLFRHLDVKLAEDDLEELLTHHSFQRLAGRSQGNEDRSSKMRKGVAGDWRNYFDRELEQVFEETTGGLLADLDYASQ